MKPYRCLRSGPNADCLTATLKSLLEDDSVPDFAKENEQLLMPEGQAYQAMQEWLNEKHGLFLLEIQLIPSMPWNPIPKAAFCIFFGKTKAGIKHAVVGACDGTAFMQLFNPLPEAELDGVESIAFLVPRDPKPRI